MQTTITPNQPCPMCGKRHRAGSKPLAACALKLNDGHHGDQDSRPVSTCDTVATVSREITSAEAEAVLVAWAKSHHGDTDTRPVVAATDRELWTIRSDYDNRGVLLGREWTSPDGRWTVRREHGGFSLYDVEEFVVNGGMVSNMIDRAEAIELGEAIVADLDTTFDVHAETAMACVRETPDTIYADTGKRTHAELQDAIRRAHTTLCEGLDAIAEMMADSSTYDYAYATGALAGRIQSALIDLEVYGGAGR